MEYQGGRRAWFSRGFDEASHINRERNAVSEIIVTAVQASKMSQNASHSASTP